MPTPNRCKARHIGDQNVCQECGLAWDANDPDPPECGLDTQRCAEGMDRILVHKGNLARRIGAIPQGEYHLEKMRAMLADDTEEKQP